MVSRPHGGRLVERLALEKGLDPERWGLTELPRIGVSYGVAVDLEGLGHGVFSPLEGFMVEEEYVEVLRRMRLPSDVPWTIPIILPVRGEEAGGLAPGDEVLLEFGGRPLAVMRVEDVYGWDRGEYSEAVYGTRDPSHPGVRRVMGMGDTLVGGRIELVGRVGNPLERYTLWPKETRVLFRERGWRTIAAFQTRNVCHMGHEYVQKAALTFVDGLLIHPLVGWKKSGDYRDEVVLESYRVLVENYFPRGSVVLAALRMNMHYAGPREAVHHAIARKNFGCTHFIVGRDHAGVGGYYGPYDAWEIFSQFPDLGITPLFIREAYYCRECGGMVNEKVCPHGLEAAVRISGTQIREMLRRGEIPPPHMMRREVAEAVLRFENPFID